jgi:hypothetical protein
MCSLPAIVTAAADVKILDIVYGIGGYAIWKVYKVVEVEVEWGYVVITITATGTVASISAINALGTAEITNAALAEVLLSYFGSAPATQYTDPDDVSDAVTTVKALVRIAT